MALKGDGLIGPTCHYFFFLFFFFFFCFMLFFFFCFFFFFFFFLCFGLSDGMLRGNGFQVVRV